MSGTSGVRSKEIHTTMSQNDGPKCDECGQPAANTFFYNRWGQLVSMCDKCVQEAKEEQDLTDPAPGWTFAKHEDVRRPEEDENET